MNRGNTVINGDYEGHALLFKEVDGLVVHTVAFALAVRDIVDDICTVGGKISIYNGCGSNAVGIIVAVDSNTLVVIKGYVDALHRLVHILKLKGAGKFHTLAYNIIYLFVRIEAADLKKHSKDSRQLVSSGNIQSFFLIKPGNFPILYIH